MQFPNPDPPTHVFWGDRTRKGNPLAPKKQGLLADDSDVFIWRIPHFMGRYSAFLAFLPRFIVKKPTTHSHRKVAVNLFFSFLVFLFFLAGRLSQGQPDPDQSKKFMFMCLFLFLVDSFRTPWRTLWGLWGSPGPESPGHPLRLFWGSGPKGPGRPLCQAAACSQEKRPKSKASRSEKRLIR